MQMCFFDFIVPRFPQKFPVDYSRKFIGDTMAESLQMAEVQIPEKVFESFFENINAEYEKKICLQITPWTRNSFYCILIQAAAGILLYMHSS